MIINIANQKTKSLEPVKGRYPFEYCGHQFIFTAGGITHIQSGMLLCSRKYSHRTADEYRGHVQGLIEGGRKVLDNGVEQMQKVLGPDIAAANDPIPFTEIMGCSDAINRMCAIWERLDRLEEAAEKRKELTDEQIKIAKDFFGQYDFYTDPEYLLESYSECLEYSHADQWNDFFRQYNYQAKYSPKDRYESTETELTSAQVNKVVRMLDNDEIKVDFEFFLEDQFYASRPALDSADIGEIEMECRLDDFLAFMEEAGHPIRPEQDLKDAFTWNSITDFYIDDAWFEGRRNYIYTVPGKRICMAPSPECLEKIIRSAY